MREHCNGEVKNTSKRLPVALVYYEACRSLAEARKRGGDLLEAAVRLNAANVARALVARSDTLRSRVENGELLIAPFLYYFESGRVEQIRY